MCLSLVMLNIVTTMARPLWCWRRDVASTRTPSVCWKDWRSRRWRASTEDPIPSWRPCRWPTARGKCVENVRNFGLRGWVRRTKGYGWRRAKQINRTDQKCRSVRLKRLLCLFSLRAVIRAWDNVSWFTVVLKTGAHSCANEPTGRKTDPIKMSV